MWSSIIDLLKGLPAREAISYVAIYVFAHLYIKACKQSVDTLQTENQRLVEEKRWLWEQLQLRVPNSGLNHYPENKQLNESSKKQEKIVDAT